MPKYNFEQKMKVVLGVEEKGLSFGAAGKIIGACSSDAQKWVKLYREHGTKGLLMKKGGYNGQFKLDVIEYMHTNHLSVRETAVKFGIPSHATVGQWEWVYYQKGRSALFKDNRGRKKTANGSKPQKPKSNKKNAKDLIVENQWLRMENAYLKKLNALVQKRNQQENGKK